MPERRKYAPRDVTQEIVDSIEVGSAWLDGMALELRCVEHYAEVVSVERARPILGDPVWTITARELHGWGRTFTMAVHGFLSRYELRAKTSPEQD